VDRTWNGEPARPGEAAVVRLTVAADGLRVAVEAPFHGDPPPPGPAGPCPGLWEHEVVEVFLVSASAGPEPEYTEVELSPHGHHLVLRLLGVRRPVATGLPLAFTVRRAEGRWHGEAELPSAYLPPGPLRGNAYAIHGEGPARRYLAHAPTGGDRPDFHRLEAFVSLALPGVRAGKELRP
jgi:hypothetical protein